MEERSDVGREEGWEREGEGRGGERRWEEGGRRGRKRGAEGRYIGEKTMYISAQQCEMSKYKYKCPFTVTHTVHLIKS